MRIAVDADLQGAIDAALGDETVGVDLTSRVLPLIRGETPGQPLLMMIFSTAGSAGVRAAGLVGAAFGQRTEGSLDGLHEDRIVDRRDGALISAS